MTIESIVRKMPAKIQQIDKLIDSKQFDFSPDSNAIDVPIPAIAKSNETNFLGNCPNAILHYPKCFVETNLTIVSLKEDLHKELLVFMGTMDGLKLLTLECTPKVEDGNNSGVRILEKARKYVGGYFGPKNASSIVITPSVMRSSHALFVIRTTVIIDVNSYSYDEDTTAKIRQTYVAMRDCYAQVAHYFELNKDKIKEPKGASNILSMY